MTVQTALPNQERHSVSGFSGDYFCLDHLNVGYEGTVVIEDVNIGIAQGEILTLIGPNGAGKSTILKTITRQLEPISGVVRFNGVDWTTIERHKLAQMISVLLTERIRPELMTCEDVVAMGRYPYTGSLGVLQPEDQKIVDEAMELVHVSELAEKDFSAISDGQRQRVMLARAICQQPDLMILDEPTSFLDVRYKLELLNILQKMSRERGMTVVMSLHELDLAERVSDRIMTVRPGRPGVIDRFGTSEEIFTPGYIDDLYGLTVGSYDESSGRVELPLLLEIRVFSWCVAAVQARSSSADCSARGHLLQLAFSRKTTQTTLSPHRSRQNSWRFPPSRFPETRQFSKHRRLSTGANA